MMSVRMVLHKLGHRNNLPPVHASRNDVPLFGWVDSETESGRLVGL